MQYCSYLGGCEAQRCIATGVWEHTVRWYFGREIGIDCNDILVVAVGDLFNAHLVSILSRKMPLHSNTIKNNNVFSLHRPSWIQHPEQQSAAQPAIETYCDTFLPNSGIRTKATSWSYLHSFWSRVKRFPNNVRFVTKTIPIYREPHIQIHTLSLHPSDQNQSHIVDQLIPKSLGHQCSAAEILRATDWEQLNI